MKTEMNTRALDAALTLVGGVIGVPNLGAVVAATYQQINEAEIRGAAEAGHDANEEYDDGYMDAVHDFQTNPAGMFERADEIEDERELRAHAYAMDATIV